MQYTVIDEAAFIENWDDLAKIPRRKGWVTVHFLDGNTLGWNQKNPPDILAIAAYFGVPPENVEVS